MIQIILIMLWYVVFFCFVLFYLVLHFGAYLKCELIRGARNLQQWFLRAFLDAAEIFVRFFKAFILFDRNPAVSLYQRRWDSFKSAELHSVDDSDSKHREVNVVYHPSPRNGNIKRKNCNDISTLLEMLLISAGILFSFFFWSLGAFLSLRGLSVRRQLALGKIFESERNEYRAIYYTVYYKYLKWEKANRLQSRRKWRRRGGRRGGGGGWRGGWGGGWGGEEQEFYDATNMEAKEKEMNRRRGGIPF